MADDISEVPPQAEANGGDNHAAAIAARGQLTTSTSEEEATQMLCSLGNAATAPNAAPSSSPTSSLGGGCYEDMPCTRGGTSKALAACPKSHQLPMFLSKTYHMIDRCEPAIATWSMDGSNFVVKNVEKFAGSVLPLYFKHSNFSSFARQLNFYGFRKLRTDPILTSDVDPRTACYVRFYHEKFQKDRPELLHQIKRATKSDQQSKDDVDSLKSEMQRLRDTIMQMREDTDRRIADMSYECNRRITSMGAEYDKLAAVVNQLIASNAAATGQAQPVVATTTAPAATAAAPAGIAGLPAVAGLPAALQNNPHAAAIAAAAQAAAAITPAMPAPPPSQPTPGSAAVTPAATVVGADGQPPGRIPDLMQSLSQAAAISLQQQQAAAAAAAAATPTPAVANATNGVNPNGDIATGNKRAAEGEASGAPPASIAKS